MALKGSKNTEHLTSRSPENNITAALTGSNNTENLTSASLENNLKAALKCSRKKPTVDDYDFTHLYFEEIFAKLLCRKKLPFATPMCSPLVSCVFVVFPQPHCSWGLLLAWRFTFQDCLAKTRTRCGPARWHFPINLDQNAILNGMNNGTPYANPELDLNIQWKTLARQKADIGLHPHPIVWRRSTTKGSERLRQKNAGGKMKEKISGYKRMWAWRVNRDKGNPGAKQNRADGDGLELARGYKRKSVEDEGHRGAKQSRADGDGLELVRGTKESQSEDKRKPPGIQGVQLFRRNRKGLGLVSVDRRTRVGRKRIMLRKRHRTANRRI